MALKNAEIIGLAASIRKDNDAVAAATFQYDDFGRVTRHTTVNGSNVGVDFAYVYDDNGNITQQDYLHRPSQPVVNAFGYDDLNRLTLADYGMGGGAEQFNYDLLGNRQAVTDSRTSDSFSYVHNEVNEYETITRNGTPATLLHDAAGNLTRDHRGYLYEYDMENRLTKVSRSDSTVVATFEYDALGRRIEKVDAIAGTTTRYYYDDQRVAIQTLVSGGVESDDRYFVFGNYIDEVLLMRTAAGTDTYYGHDHLYSTVVLFAANGSVVERYEYDAYGQVQILSSGFSVLGSSQYENPYTFTGRELDALDAGSCTLMYYRARSYDPETGRFIQRDPLGVNPAVSKMPIDPIGQYYDSLSLYEYVSSKPLVELDPSGTKIEVVKKQHTNESTIPGTRGMVRSTLSSDFKCKKQWFSCKAKLILDITGAIDLYLLQIGHPDWALPNRYPRYHTKWGNPRSNLTERYATRSHELDHWYTTEAFWRNTKSTASPFDGKIYNDMATCQRAGQCVISAVFAYFYIADSHSASFDNPPLWQGGMYFSNPFVTALNLSHCP
jgi:RHS repeat-associated protein